MTDSESVEMEKGIGESERGQRARRRRHEAMVIDAKQQSEKQSFLRNVV